MRYNYIGIGAFHYMPKPCYASWLFITKKQHDANSFLGILDKALLGNKDKWPTYELPYLLTLEGE